MITEKIKKFGRKATYSSDRKPSKINDEMKIAAAYAIKDCVSENELSEEHIIPSVFDKNVSSAVARAVAEAAVKTGVSRLNSL